jgi:hypothetical protein
MASRQVVKTILAELETENGRLSPDDVIERAKDPTSPLHEHFIWDDTEAAEKFRRMQASHLIRSVKVEVTIHKIPLSAPCYVRDPASTAPQQTYANVVHVRSDEEKARAVVVDEMQRVSKAVRRAKSVAAVLGLVDAIDQIDELARSIVRDVDLNDEERGTA